jgi:hypothetical protein
MKPLVLSIFFFILFSLKAQTWQWAKSVGCLYNGYWSDATCVCVDKNGNVYATGVFYGEIYPPNYTLSSPSEWSSYLLKYDANGNFKWATNTYGAQSQESYVTCDSRGNVLLAGAFSPGTIAIGSTSLSSSGLSGYLFKIDSLGNVLWASNPTGTYTSCFSSVSCDKNDNIILCGTYLGDVTFGTNTITTPSGTQNAFIAKYDKYGNALWVKAPACTGSAEGWSVDSDQNGNLYMAGNYNNGSLTFDTIVFPNSGSDNIFFAKYSPVGNLTWVERAAGAGSNYVASLSVDDFGNCYLTGRYDSLIAFNTTTLTGSGGNLFLVKYNTNGNLLWAKNSIGKNTTGWSLHADNLGTFIAGGIDSLSSGIFGNYTLTPPSNSKDPSFLARCDTNGNVTFAQTFKSGGDDWISVTSDPSCNVYLSGDFWTNSFVLGSNTLNLSCGEQVFTAKLSFNSPNCPEVGIRENPKILNSKVYPNPVSNNLIIELNETITTGEVRLFDSFGREVHRKIISRGTNNIDTEKFPKGLYDCLIILDNNKVESYKLLFE